MPLSRDAFYADGEPATPVLDFLRRHANEALTFGELAQELANTDVTLDDLDFALRNLEDNGVIASSPLEGKVYYIYAEAQVG